MARSHGVSRLRVRLQPGGIHFPLLLGSVASMERRVTDHSVALTMYSPRWSPGSDWHSGHWFQKSQNLYMELGLGEVRHEARGHATANCDPGRTL